MNPLPRADRMTRALGALTGLDDRLQVVVGYLTDPLGSPVPAVEDRLRLVRAVHDALSTTPDLVLVLTSLSTDRAQAVRRAAVQALEDTDPALGSQGPAVLGSQGLGAALRVAPLTRAAEALAHLLRREGGQEVLTHLGAAPDELARLHLMPTCGTRYYTHAGGRGPGTEESEWTLVYANDLSPDQVAQGFAVVEEQARRLGLWSERTWGPALEDRGSQITFSALGQEAPIEAKRVWDPTGEKRAALRDAVAPLLPDLEVRAGGATSIDITLKGVDKAYGMRRLAEVTGIGLERMLFIGDRLDPEGNDYPVKVLGVPCHAVTGWRDTAEFVTALAGDLAAARGRGK